MPAQADDVARIQWVNVAPLAEPVQPAAPAPAATLRKPTRRSTRQTAAPARAELVTPVAPSTEAAVPDDEASKNASAILAQARRDVGKIDKELIKAYPLAQLRAKEATPVMRLRSGIQAAADAVPNKWYEAPKITEVVEPGQYGRKRYRVVGALGTYCLTYEAPGTFGGMERGTKSKMTSCDPKEQKPAK